MAKESTLGLDKKVGMAYYTTDTVGIGGRIKVWPEDFSVVENSILEPKSDGEHLALVIWKREVSTTDVVKHISEVLGVSRKLIGVAGMKDKRAVAVQKLSIPSMELDPKEVEVEGRLRVLGAFRVKRKIRIGHLRGNYFTIRVRGVSGAEPVDETADQLERRGCPNFYGYQRFGRECKNHELGKLLLKREYGEVFRRLGLRAERPGIRELLRLDTRLLRFFVGSYQSYLFNLMVSERIRRGLPVNSGIDGDFVKAEEAPAFPIVGYKSKLPTGEAGEIVKSVLQEESTSLDDFRHEVRKLRQKGGLRKVYLTYRNLGYELDGNSIVFRFWLEKGCYATVLLREFCKWERPASDAAIRGAGPVGPSSLPPLMGVLSWVSPLPQTSNFRNPWSSLMSNKSLF